jgi:hypothetical protein
MDFKKSEFGKTKRVDTDHNEEAIQRGLTGNPKALSLAK